uniref:Prefoldin subunit 2 n=1 Tax=Setaria digitata TaxID=48799 RepID=A0A915PX43_9BILA
MSNVESSETKDNKDKSLLAKDKDKYPEEKEDRNAVIAALQQLREQQKNIIVELTRIEDDKREHERVLKVLRKMEGDRKCFRMIGTTLVEHQISTVIPILESTLHNLDALIDSLKDNLVEKGKELQEFTEKHNIHFVSEKEMREQSENNAKK